MTETPIPTTNDDPFTAIAQEATDRMVSLAKEMVGARNAAGEDPNDYVDPILAGLLHGVVYSACRVTPARHRAEAMQRLREALELSIAYHMETEDTGSMVQ